MRNQVKKTEVSCTQEDSGKWCNVRDLAVGTFFLDTDGNLCQMVRSLQGDYCHIVVENGKAKFLFDDTAVRLLNKVSIYWR